MRLERYEYGLHGTFGHLFVGNNTVLHTLERPWEGNAPFLSCIPEGTYLLVRHEGEKYPDTWALVGGTVGHYESDGKPRWACVFHAGNWVSDTTGCVLVGVGRDGDMLTGSREAMGMLREALRVAEPLPQVVIVNVSGGVGTGPSPELEEPAPLPAVARVAVPEVDEVKSWLKSKTLWFNVVGGALAAFVSQAQQLQAAGVDSQVLSLVLVAGNIALRFVTREPIVSGSK